MNVFSVLRPGFHRSQTEQPDRTAACRVAPAPSGE